MKVEYAKRLDSVGDLIINISNLIKSPEEVDVFSFQNFKIYKEEMNEKIKCFEYATESLKEVKTPLIIQNLHNEYVEWFRKYIESIIILNDSNNVRSSNEIHFNESEYDRGFALQEKSVSEIRIIFPLIGDKLLNYL